MWFTFEYVEKLMEEQLACVVDIILLEVVINHLEVDAFKSILLHDPESEFIG